MNPDYKGSGKTLHAHSEMTSIIKGTFVWFSVLPNRENSRRMYTTSSIIIIIIFVIRLIWSPVCESVQFRAMAATMSSVRLLLTNKIWTDIYVGINKVILGIGIVPNCDVSLFLYFEMIPIPGGPT